MQMKRTLLFLILLRAAFTAQAQITYQNVAETLGIEHSYGTGIAGGGVSFCDFNGDGLDDLSLATEEDGPRFFRNTGSGFVELSLLPQGISQPVKQILWADYDNDGDKDLFLAVFEGQNYLFENTGDNTLYMEDVSNQAGMPDDGLNTYGACWGDFNRDGWIDLYFGSRMGNDTTYSRHYLLMNKADGTFEDVALSAGADDPHKLQFCSAFLDFNNDRWPDIYTSHDKTKGNTLLRNNGDGTFSDLSQSSGAGVALNAMCVAVGDYDRDGYQDIYVSNTPAGNALLHNLGDETFEEVAAEAGVALYQTSWGSLFFDADNDGDEDLYVCGMFAGSDPVTSTFFENEGDGTFSQPDAGFEGDTVTSFNNATGDFNNDGYPDMMVVNTAPYNSQLWQNSGGNNHWIKIRLEGVLSNRDGIGSRIELWAGGQYQMKYTHCGIGFLGQNSETLIFGLGANSSADSILITWPTGHQDRLYDQSSGQTLEVLEGSTTNGQIEVDPDVSIITSVQEIPAFAKFQTLHTYPNPASEQVFITVPHLPKGKGEMFSTARLFDEQGRLSGFRQMQPGGKTGTFYIDISTLPSGKYHLCVYSLSGERFMSTFIKP